MTTRYEVTVTVKQSGIDDQETAEARNNIIYNLIYDALWKADLLTGDTVLGAHIESYDPEEGEVT